MSLNIKGFSPREKSLWSIALRKPKSKRFSQLSFEGFKPKGKNVMEQLLKTFFGYFKFVAYYIRKKLKKTLRLFKNIFIKTIASIQAVKETIVRKLIWSRGKLARPIATSIVMGFSFFIFMLGKVLNSSKFVNSQEINPDYLSNVTDIIPQRNVAITTIPESRKRSEPFEYTVLPGDTLSSIGNNFKISVDALRYVNNIKTDDVLSVGQTLTIPPISGLIHKVASGDSLTSIARKYDVPSQAIADFNYILDTSRIAVGTELVIPNAKVPQPIIVSTGFTTISSGPVTDTGASYGWCLWPTTARVITQNFSWYHNGVDIAVPSGQGMPPLYACAEGIVIRSGWDPFGLGLHVMIDHGNGYQTVYGHMSRLDVGYGERVGKGQTIGAMGSTGRSTGPHIHFIIKYQGVPQDPLNYIN